MSAANSLAITDNTLLLVDDDVVFLGRLERAMAKRGFQVLTRKSVAEGSLVVQQKAPAFAVVDLRLEDGSGLEIVSRLHEKRSDARAIILTGYGNIATAVTAVKLGVADFLAKPADADDVYNALLGSGKALPPPPEYPMTADRVRWEHIQRVFELCDQNISETARRLGMHRRTLQRILGKRAPR